MQKLPKLAMFGGAALCLAGAAVAAAPASHVMDVAVPGGGTAHVEYYGDVAPKVTFDRGYAPASVGWAPVAFPDFGDFERIFEQMDRARDRILRQTQEMQRHAGSHAATANVASYGNLPAGTNSVSVVSVSNGGGTCTRTTEVTSQGAGKPPKVVSNVSGRCSAKAAPATHGKPVQPRTSSGPVSQT